MPGADATIDLYVKLAEENGRRARFQERDRFLLLAADAALTAGQATQAEQLRQSLLAQNPHHLLKPYRTLAEAVQSPDILAYLQQLRRSYSYEKAEHLLETLRAEGHNPGRHTDEEFALPLDVPSGAQAKERTVFGLAPETQKARSPEEKPRGSERKGSTHPAKPSTPARPAPNLLRVESKPTPADEVEQDLVQPGAWVGSLLFVLILGAALALLYYSIVRPLLALN